MSNKWPDQQLYDQLFKESYHLGYETYTFLPPDNTPFPFVVISSVQLVPRATKSYLIGRVIAVIDIWGDEGSRRVVSDMANDLLHQISKIKQIEGGHRWRMLHDLTSVEILQDNSSADDLWRARIEVQLEFE